MEKPISLLKLKQQLHQKKKTINQDDPNSAAGFTLIELLMVIIIVGVIATLGGPGWFAFVNQRRVNSANEVVFRALQEAQSQAKNKKRSYSVSFKNDNGVPEVAVYPTSNDPDNYWKSLGQELAIKPNQITLGTNLDGENSVNNNVSYNPDDADRITFDYMGTLPPDAELDDNNLITVVVGVPDNNDEALELTKRCVKVKTLLGALTTGRGAECDN